MDKAKTRGYPKVGCGLFRGFPDFFFIFSPAWFVLLVRKAYGGRELRRLLPGFGKRLR